MAVNPIETYVQILYTSAFGSHTMTRPTRDWNGTPWADVGTFTTWEDGTINAGGMIDDFIDACLPLFKPDTTFNSWTIYKPPSLGEPAIPVYAANLSGKIGTSADTSQSRAWQRTYTFRGTGSYLAKIVLLDTPCSGQVSRYNSVAALSPDQALIDLFIAPTNSWSCRADERPVWFKTLTTQTNQALEHKYGVN